tara:strand:+ start:9725 stop:10207 length:483 start_codon:yes stop_codon:yes gene_type:complete
MSNSHIDYLLDIFLTALKSPANDAGWEGDSEMARLIEFQGEIPRGTGNDQSNMSMVITLDKNRNEHHELRRIRETIYSLLGDGNHDTKVKALLAKKYYLGLCASTERTYSDLDRMMMMGGYSPKSEDEALKAVKRFRDRAAAAYPVIEAELLKYDRRQAA